MKTESTLSGGASVLASRICRRPDGSRGRSPHQSLIFFALVFAATLASAATNDLSGLLQKGLFEEEANRNLEAAAQAYSTVSAQFDKDRKLAATAIFRLGEIYRKQGKTNEAAGQYERIVREFADQDTLVTLSRQNLAGLGNTAGEKSNRPDNVQRQYLEQQSTVAEMEALIAQLKKLDRDELRRVLPKVSPDPLLRSLLDEMSDAVPSYAAVLKIRGEADPTTKEQAAKLNQLEQQVDERADEVIAGLERRLTAARNQLDWLKSQAQPGRPGGAGEPLSKAARLEQKRLLEEVISIVEKKLESQRQIISSGRVSQADILTTQQELLALKRQLVVVSDTQFDSSNPAAETVTTDDEEKEIRRIQAMIKNSPDLINAPSSSGSTPLHTAASQGQLTVARFLLDNKANVNARNNNRETPLTLAALQGHKAMVELLLSRGADVNAPGGGSYTALHYAASRGFNALVETLMAKQAVIDARNNGGETPLHLAAAVGHVAIAEALLNRRADANALTKNEQTPLFNAATAGHSAMIKVLLAAKAKVDAVDNNGRTALSYAAEKGHVDSVKALLAAKADANLGQRDLPLPSAVIGRHPEIAETLLRGGANPNLAAKLSHDVRAPGGPDFQLGTIGTFGPYLPLQIAVADRNVSMVKLLLKYKANANALDPWAQPPKSLLFYALQPRDVDLLNAFLEAGANPNAVDARGNTALLNAVLSRSPGIVRALLEAGAKSDPHDGSGATPLYSAILTDNADCVEMLLAHGADTEIMVNGVYSSLRTAVERGIKKIVEALLEAGAEINAKGGGDGRTALHQAVEYRDLEMASLLLERKADPNLRDASGQTPLDLVKASFPAPGQARSPLGANRPPAAQKDLAALLRQHGAVDDLPNLDRIEVRRPEARFAKSVFLKSTNDWNQFTLLEAILNAYSGAQAIPSPGQPYAPLPPPGIQPQLPFPNLHRVVVVRPSRTPGQPPERRVVDLLSPTGEVDCAKDVALGFGDVVEIPERDHTLQESAVGLTQIETKQMQECRGGKVGLLVKGKETALKVWPYPNGIDWVGARTGRRPERTVFHIRSVSGKSHPCQCRERAAQGMAAGLQRGQQPRPLAA
ncbi:MAG: ankyrin repeat domain-containing protein [Verrucomicrobiota bacterium]